MNNGYGGASYYNNGRVIPTQYFNNYSENVNPMTVEKLSPKKVLYNALAKIRDEKLAQEQANKVMYSNIPAGALGLPATNPIERAKQYLYVLYNNR